MTNEFFYSFVGNKKLVSTIRTLLARAKKENVIPYLKLISSSGVNSEEVKKRFIVKEDRDNFDYILSVKELCQLQGEKYHKHRKLIHKFQREHPRIRPTVLDLNNKQTQKDILTLFTVWEKAKNKSHEEAEHELKAIRRIFVDPGTMCLLSVGMYDDNNLISFLIVDVSHDSHAQSHFFKTDPSYVGATQLVRQFMALLLEQKRIEHLNIEQDLGIPGLRISKEHWNPALYVKKYSIHSHNA